MQWIALIGPILEELMSIAASATTGQASSIINMLEGFIKLAVGAAPDLLVPIQNIITALSGNAAVTADQVAQLQAQSNAIDAALDSAAADDKLT